MVVKPPFLKRLVAQWCNGSVIVGKRALSDIEAPHAGMPDGSMSRNQRQNQGNRGIVSEKP